MPISRSVWIFHLFKRCPNSEQYIGNHRDCFIPENIFYSDAAIKSTQCDMFESIGKLMGTFALIIWKLICGKSLVLYDINDVDENKMSLSEWFEVQRFSTWNCSIKCVEKRMKWFWTFWKRNSLKRKSNLCYCFAGEEETASYLNCFFVNITDFDCGLFPVIIIQICTHNTVYICNDFFENKMKRSHKSAQSINYNYW